MRILPTLLLLAACNSKQPEPPRMKVASPLTATAGYARIDGVHGYCTPLPDGTEKCCPVPTGSAPCTVQAPW
jgi:hypothetical protein